MPYLAKAQLTVGLTSQARRLLSNGVKLVLNKPTPWNLLGAAKVERHHLTKAMADFGRAISLDPRYVSIYLNIGHLKELEGAYSPHILSQALMTNRQLFNLI